MTYVTCVFCFQRNVKRFEVRASFVIDTYIYNFVLITVIKEEMRALEAASVSVEKMRCPEMGRYLLTG